MTTLPLWTWEEPEEARSEEVDLKEAIDGIKAYALRVQGAARMETDDEGDDFLPEEITRVSGLMREVIECLAEFVLENFTGPLREALEKEEKDKNEKLAADARREEETGQAIERFVRPDKHVSEASSRIANIKLGAPQRKACQDHLMTDGETAVPSIHAPLLLIVAREFLQALPNCPQLIALGSEVWKMRAVYIHQRVMEHRCHTLRMQAQDAFVSLVTVGAGDPESVFFNSESALAGKTDKVFGPFGRAGEFPGTDFSDLASRREVSGNLVRIQLPRGWNNKESDTPSFEVIDYIKEAVESAREDAKKAALPYAMRVRRVLLHLEVGYLYTHYMETERATFMFKRAEELSGLKLEVLGQLGLRTDHQQEMKAQLTLKLEFGEGAKVVGTEGEDPTYIPEGPLNIETEGKRPRMIQSEDCNVRQRPTQRNLVFKEEQPGDIIDSDSNLRWCDQALLMAQCLNVKNNNPFHGLTNIQMLPYLERILDNTNLVYSNLVMILIIKSRIESERNRVRERAVLQLQELLDNLVDLQGDRRRRTENFFSFPIPSVHELNHETARLYIGFGMYRTAEQLATEVQDWNFVVECCQLQGNRGRAEKISKEQLARDPGNPVILCALGEATRNPEYFLQAWELSGQRLGRAMRGLAKLALEQKDYQKTVECFDKALTLNPLYGSNWFQMGYAAFQIQDWKTACRAYTRVVSIEPEDGQAWTNLGLACWKLGKEPEALYALGEATKKMEYNWQVRHNHLRLAYRMKEWNKVIQDLQKLIELKGHEYKLDEEMIIDMGDALVGQMKAGVTTTKIVGYLVEKLLGSYTFQPSVYIFAATYYGATGDIAKQMDNTVNAFRYLVGDPHWVRVGRKVDLVDQVIATAAKCRDTLVEEPVESRPDLTKEALDKKVSDMEAQRNEDLEKAKQAAEE